MRRAVGALISVLIFALPACGHSIDRLGTPSDAGADAEDTALPAPPPCVADDIPALRACLQAAREGSTQRIEITRVLECPSRAACDGLWVMDLEGPLTIAGREGRTAGFKRTAEYNYPIFLFIGVNNLTIDNLVFDDGDEDCDIDIAGNCQAMVGVLSSKNVTIERVTTLHAVMDALEFRGVEGLRIARSRFVDSGVTGLWLSRADQTIDLESFDRSPDVIEADINRFVEIDGNFFLDNHTAAANFAAFGTPERRNRLTRNLFVRNHAEPAFFTCDGPCPGGQLVIERNRYSLVEGNVIKDGRMTDPLHATGVETSDRIEEIIFRGNVVTNNDGAGLFADYRAPAFLVDGDTVLLHENEFSDNGYDEASRATQIYDDDLFQQDGNCFARGCAEVPLAKLVAELPVCDTLGACTVFLRWFSHDVGNLEVVRGSEVIATSAEGMLQVNGVGATSETFELRSAGSVLDTLVVSGPP